MTTDDDSLVPEAPGPTANRNVSTAAAARTKPVAAFHHPSLVSSRRIESRPKAEEGQLRVGPKGRKSSERDSERERAIGGGGETGCEEMQTKWHKGRGRGGTMLWWVHSTSGIQKK